ncbi:MAG TPA: alkaline phosphatase PhoX [Frankiaceae bacterium]|nr:alkaline phosphatase PhoX [Frankiaceae bacterium]
MHVRNRKAWRRSKRTTAVTVAGLSTLGFVLVGSAGAAPQSPFSATDAGPANPKAIGITYPNKLSPGLIETIAAQGSMKLENGTPAVPYYGYSGTGPMVPAVGSTAETSPNEAQKTEPDKNTYLDVSGQHGADPSYHYGRHFVYQGHEAGAGYLTRINLDANVDHRVTLLATQDSDGKALPTFDGSTWDPFAHRLLFTAEGSNGGGVWQSTLDPVNGSTTVNNLQGILGKGGYEGIQNDSAGNVWIVEDASGAAPDPTNAPGAKVPNSFVYRFVPTDRADLTKGGRLQALQVKDANGNPIVFNGTNALTATIAALHTYGSSFKTSWVTIHDTATDGTTPYSANELAKPKGATPFKRPENGVFRPGTRFGEFFFTETGDTSATSAADNDFGGYGGIFKLSQSSPTADSGRLSLFYKGDKAHTGLDNIQFLGENELTAVEDAGDTLHTQRDALDSGYTFDTRASYANGRQPVRWLAEGRDASATLDSGYSDAKATGDQKAATFQNDGDNEITGVHVSDGDPGIGGILGAQAPHPFKDGWRVFFTQQHGDNVTWEVLPSTRNDSNHGHGSDR